jgi:cellulose synthase/poly-beta-1,6-N-acetylglucosamine synthase-like glycosyltransferase
MAIVWQVTFWIAFALIGYAYVGYPLLAMLVARRRARPVRVDPAFRPTVTLIIAACNEERVIREKLENTLQLTYPRQLLDIVVVADGSDDGTADVVRAYQDRGVRLLHQPHRQGKTAALNRAVAATTGEIVLFSDANTFYAPATVERMVRNFADPDVGGVSGRKIVMEDRTRAATDGEIAYWAFETQLKQWESLAGSIVTADGEIFAMRRSLFQPIPRDIVHDDMYLTLGIVESGSRVVFEPQATSAEQASRTLYDEFHLKVRYASAGYQIVGHFWRLLLPPTSWFALEFVSHKLLRWMAPLFLVVLFVSSALAGGTTYLVLFTAQAAFYAIALVGWIAHKRIRPAPLYFPLYFTVMNSAALYGTARYVLRGQTTLWRKAAR